MKKIIGTLLLAMLITMTTKPAMAAKKRVWSKTTVNGPGVNAKLTKWKQYVYLGFYGLSKVEKVEYELVYKGNGTEQGVFGDIKVEKDSIGRELFMGTCSHGVCVAHRNISNLRLTINYRMKDGKGISKRYKLKY